ncbi:hypothetical protein FB451DRAFT_1524447 [Mycena latifolia]|nr:hypothetical protein FB451DRAFT_1524447 [Mycena latifolia]
MSRQPSVTEIRLNSIIACLTPTLALLDELNDTFGTPFVPAISNTTLSLISAVQNVKRNKDDCIQLLENVYQLLYAIINLHIKSETKGSLDPATLDHVGKFTETLHKIHTFVEAQQDQSKIMHFFRQIETKTFLGECRAGLQQAFEVFKTETGFTALGSITEMQEEAERMHTEVLELISTLSDGTTSDRSSSVRSFSFLSEAVVELLHRSTRLMDARIAKPKIFHGREQELKEIVDILQQESARIAILGAGGMGKTSLAKAALHHPDIAAKYEQCFFVVADSVTTSVGLSGLIGEHIAFKPAKDLTKQVIQYFATHGPSLLILDNLETPWEPLQSRGEVEELVSKLTDVPHLALMITMRGAERPAKVQWTRPFLAPLKPLSDVAARDTFFAIAEDGHDSKDVDEVLSLTDNMPLAVDLMAHAVDLEGSCSAVLARWKSEKTSLLSAGNDRKSDLDTSITISLSSSRMSTGAKDLLRLLSILPDGLSDVELFQSKLSMNDIMTCKATLLATSLAYIDDKRMQQGAGRIKHIALNAGNIRELLLQGLNQDNPNLAETIECTLSMKFLMKDIGSGYYHMIPMLMDQIEAVLPGNCDEKVKAQLISWKFESHSPCLATDADILITQAISHFHQSNDPALESTFYCQVGLYYFYAESQMAVALKYLHKALHLAKSHGGMRREASVLNHLGTIKWLLGDYPAAQLHAQASYRLAELAGDLYYQSMAPRTSALCYGSCGDTQNTIVLCKRAQKLLELCGITTGFSYTNLLQSLADTQFLKSEYVEARNIHMQLARDAATQDPYNSGFSLLNIAQLDIIIGESKQDVLSTLDKAMALFDAHRYGGYNVMSAKIYCNIVLGQLHLREGEILTAKGILQTCVKSAWGNDAQGVLSCMESLANIKDWRDSDFRWAASWTVVYLGYAKKLGDKIALHRALQFLGDVFQAEGDNATSTSLFAVALEGFTQMDIHRSRAGCMLGLGDLAKGHGDASTAIELWKIAKPLFERSSQGKQVARIDDKLAAISNNVLEEPTDSLTGLGQLSAPISCGR